MHLTHLTLSVIPEGTNNYCPSFIVEETKGEKLTHPRSHSYKVVDYRAHDLNVVSQL